MFTAYVVGPTAGKGRHRTRKCEKYLESQGYNVIVSREAIADAVGREKYMHIATELISRADEVYFVEGWRDSPAARMEHAIATFLGKQVRLFW